MVAVIKTGHSVSRILNYNENKVREGVAQCIGEGNYPMGVESMNFTIKLLRLLRQNALNENVKRGSVHVSLNFDPSEKYSKEKLMDIARSYMDKIGFGSQPYLVYEHYDAGHPHIHVVSIKVREDGSRIDMQNIGRNESEKARKEIEISFGLVNAERRNTPAAQRLQPIVCGRVEYGKMQSKKAIATVLSSVLHSYKYASLAELNAVLLQYNVMADRGSEQSRVFQSGGLLYRIVGSDSKPVGVPIKASDFSGKPTLSFLEQKFTFNRGVYSLEKKRIKNAVDLAFLKNKPTLEGLVKVLEKEGICAVLRRSEQGKLYGITYVDHTTKCIFNGSALGKSYSARMLEERCGHRENQNQKAGAVSLLKESPATRNKDASRPSENWIGNKNQDTPTAAMADNYPVRLIDLLVQTEWQPDSVPGELRARRKRRKRKGQSDR